jgi:hypothetical protein
MENPMNMKQTGSNIWPYVAVGSAIGGAIGYLFMTEPGRKIRHSITHPDELADDIQDVRDFVERKARVVTDQVHQVLDKAKSSIDAGERAYREAEINFQGQVRQVEGKSNEIASSVHHTVDNVKSTAVTLEKSVLDPLFELGALYKGIERGVRTLIGKDSRSSHGPTPIYRDSRIMGS